MMPPNLHGNMVLVPLLATLVAGADCDAADLTRLARSLPVLRDCPACPELLALPAGRVRLGSPKGELGRQLDEGPQREIPVNAFAIGRFEVTFAEWDACAAARACPYADDYDFGRGRQPVIMVSWDDAQVYLKWLRRRTGQHYRLPTEAEWEWAARAGRSTRYPWGEMFEPARANGGDAPTAVGLHPPNRFGLHDMIGNVREWVHDCRSFSYRNHPGDASPYLEPNCTFRTARGGSWGTDAAGLRVANRSSHCQDNRSTITGFRVARDLDAGLR